MLDFSSAVLSTLSPYPHAIKQRPKDVHFVSLVSGTYSFGNMLPYCAIGTSSQDEVLQADCMMPITMAEEVISNSQYATG